MRFVNIDDVKDGMINAKTLVGNNFEILLRNGITLRKPYIEKLKELGYQGIYIQDDISDGITISDVIDPALRLECVKMVKDIYFCTTKGKYLNNRMVKDLNKVLDKVVEDILSNNELMINIIDLKNYDDYTYSHSVNVATLSLSVGNEMNLSKKMLFNLGMASLLHDIGKMFIPQEILNKKGKLTDEEYEIVKTHSFKGYQILKENAEFSYYSSIGVLHHHEKYDGTGYPFELKENKISILGRIIAIADVYDALISDRPYRKSLFPSEALEYIMGGGGTFFDTEIVRFFTKIVAPYPIGTGVLLSNNSTGIVIKNYRDCCMRPVVKIIKQGDELITPYFIDLKNDSNARGIVITGIAKI